MLDHKKIQRVLEIILEGLIYLSFLMPFIFVDTSIFPFIVGKVLYFEAVVQLMVAVYILLLAINWQKYRPCKNLLFYWLIFYGATLLLSAIFGIDFDRAFWSNFERMTGVFLIFHCIIYGFIVSIVFNTPKKIKRAIQVLLAVSLIEVAVVLAQYMKPGVFLYENKGGRVWGTLGNSIYIGSYFLFHIFFALYLAIKEKKQLWQVLYLFIAMLESYLIIHSRSSRGADLAFVSAVVFIIFAYALLSKNKKIRLLAFVLLLSGALFFVGAFIFRENRIVRSIPVVGTIVNSSLKEGTGRTRLIAWKIAVESFRERPIFGWGLENFYYVFNKYYNPESLRYSYYETWFDRSHSVIFDTLSSGGAVGMISYFGMFAAAEYLMFSAWRRSRISPGRSRSANPARDDIFDASNGVDKHALIFFTVIFATYLIQILFVFDQPSSYLLLYFTFGLLLSLIGGERKSVEPKYTLTGPSLGVISCLVMVGFLVIFFTTSVRTHKAAIGIIDAERVFMQNPQAGLEKYREILAMKTPFIDDMRLTMAKRISQINPSVLRSYPDYKQVVLFAREEMLKEIKARDIDVYDFLVLAQIDTLLAEAEPRYFDSAEKFFAKARELSPKRQQIYYAWAKTKTMRGDTEGAIKLVKDALSFDKEIAESYWYLGLLYHSQGKMNEAWGYFKQAAVEKHYSWKSQDELKFVLDLGERLRKDNDLIEFYAVATESFLSSAELYLNWGKVYIRLGKQEKATEAFMKARELDASLFRG